MNGIKTEFATDDEDVFLVYEKTVVAVLSQKGFFYSSSYQSRLYEDNININSVGKILKGRGIDGDRIFSKFDSYLTIQE